MSAETEKQSVCLAFDALEIWAKLSGVSTFWPLPQRAVPVERENQVPSCISRKQSLQLLLSQDGRCPAWISVPDLDQEQHGRIPGVRIVAGMGLAINTAEADNAGRETRELAICEPCRTLPGHFRHECEPCY